MSKRPELSLAEYYASAPEETRLDRGRYVLERARTQELIQRYLAAPPAMVLDADAIECAVFTLKTPLSEVARKQSLDWIPSKSPVQLSTL